MVKIRIEREDGKIRQFFAEGHTAFAKKGEDIVCAGISSILQTAILGLSDYLKVSLALKKGSGDMSVRLKNPPGKEAEAILEAMLLGLCGIEKEYPDRVKIIEVPFVN